MEGADHPAPTKPPPLSTAIQGLISWPDRMKRIWSPIDAYSRPAQCCDQRACGAPQRRRNADGREKIYPG